jgi:hypothetical protein
MKHLGCSAYESDGTLKKLRGLQPDVCDCGATLEPPERVIKAYGIDFAERILGRQQIRRLQETSPS